MEESPSEGDAGQYAEEEEWWSGQFYSLGFGLLCGVVFHFIVNRLSMVRNLQQGGLDGPPRGAAEMGNVRSAAAASGNPLSTMSRMVDNKMVLVVRTDIGMGKGKACAQCAHAAVACYKDGLKKTPRYVKQWEMFGQTKVTLKTDSVETLSTIKEKAEKLGLVALEVCDAGRTQIDAGTVTVLGVGPGPSKLVDEVTGHLKLY